MPDFLKTLIEPGEIVSFLRRDICLKDVCQRILSQKIITRSARERGLTVTPEEVQAEADRLRREQRLEKATDTLAWLAEQMITADDWEAGIRDRLLAQKLAECLFAKEVEKFFAQNRLDFEQVLLYQIIVSDEKFALELFYAIEEREVSFYQAAHFYDVDERRRYHCGCEGKLYRWSLKPDIAAAVFGTQIGELVGPLKTEQGYHLLIVEELIPSELKPEIYQDILSKMFREWLASELTHLLYNKTI